jgi:hypothetical protein
MATHAMQSTACTSPTAETCIDWAYTAKNTSSYLRSDVSEPQPGEHDQAVHRPTSHPGPESATGTHPHPHRGRRLPYALSGTSHANCGPLYDDFGRSAAGDDPLDTDTAKAGAWQRQPGCDHAPAGDHGVRSDTLSRVRGRAPPALRRRW